MAPKKTQLKSLSKGVNAKKAAAVKGGRKKEVSDATTGKLAVNHNQVQLKNLPVRQTGAVKGGASVIRIDRLAANHNLVVLA